MGIALLAGPANVIMQLARPGVGYGVKESRVESGRVDRHPIKRARTTFTYLAVATRGSDEQKKAYRRAVNRSHAQVYSTPDSPVEYNAFDKELQLWVGRLPLQGCRRHLPHLRRRDGRARPPTSTTATAWRWARRCRCPLRCGRPTERPSTSTGSSRWSKVHIDDTVREYLYPIAVSRMRGVRLPGPIQRANERLALLITTGFLPQTVPRRDAASSGTPTSSANSIG